jgi:DNA/RNA endonuclease YhcR with UshA esterase domain
MKYLLLLLSAGFLFADEPIAVSDAAAITAKMNQEVTVTGVPNAQSNKSAAGHFFYHFDGTNFTIYCYQASAATFPEDKQPAALVGKPIEVKGKITMFKDKPQIAIRSAEQIVLLPEKNPTEKSTPEKGEKK